MPDWVLLFVHATRLGSREGLFPSPSLSHRHHWLQYPILSSLICENSQIEPLREGLTEDGDDGVLWPVKMNNHDLAFCQPVAATGHEFFFRLEIAPSRHSFFPSWGSQRHLCGGDMGWEIRMMPRGCGFGVRMPVERPAET
jgi:hypothetical protein